MEAQEQVKEAEEQELMVMVFGLLFLIVLLIEMDCLLEPNKSAVVLAVVVPLELLDDE
jgi:hypothetical protein